MKTMIKVVAGLCLALYAANADAGQAPPAVPIACRPTSSRTIIGGIDIGQMRCALVVLSQDRDRLAGQLSTEELADMLATGELAAQKANNAALAVYWKRYVKGLAHPAPAAK